MKYKVNYVEKVFHQFEVEAENADEAEDKMLDMLNNGEADLSDGDVIDSEIEFIPE